MLLTIFGAGASYDSAAAVRPNVSRSDIAQWRPPLTDGLFADREEFRPLLVDFPRVLPLAARLGQASATQPLEGMLLRLQEEALDYPARFSDLASIRYYLQRVIWECERFWHQERRATTNHLALMDRIQRWRRGNIGEVLFTTFNYDRFLEYAASFYLSDASTIYHNQF